mmetsp:Transcript_45945/g.127513  ORF Transcript_45945/g.127513 Transcript_45945/m.127513 type:complete len:289 (-) Transcript_45945:96-962(-)
MLDSPLGEDPHVAAEEQERPFAAALYATPGCFDDCKQVNFMHACYQEYWLSIRKCETKGMGLTLATHGTTLRITKIKDGPINEWNESHPSCPVRVGDCVVGVNGTEGSAVAMLATFRSCTECRMLLRRENEYSFILSRVGSVDIGLGIAWREGSDPAIEQVTAGPIKRWNEENPDLQVRKGDRIVAVNGVRGNTQAMLNELKISHVWQVQVHRKMKWLVDHMPCSRGPTDTARECAICYSDFEPQAWVKTMPCDHAFCVPCIDRWLMAHSSSCPLCRTQIGASPFGSV